MNDITKDQLKHLFPETRLAVLATQKEGVPYCSLVAFASTENLEIIIFATERNTRKYSNIMADPRVSMLIDNRSNSESDFQQTLAVTIEGRAEEVTAGEKEALMSIYIRKHPYLNDFLKLPACALMEVKVDAYYMVSRFQDVTMLKIK